MFVALAEIRIDNLHCRFAIVTPRNQLFGCFKIAFQNEFSIWNDDPKAAARDKDAVDLPRNILSVGERKMLQHVFTEDAVKTSRRKRQSPCEIEQKIDVKILVSIYVDPVLVASAPWARSKI